MTVTVDDPFKSPPRISADKFVDVLRSVGSFDADALWEPWAANQREDAARRIYDYLVEKGHDPAVWLAVAGKEHTFGTNRQSVLWRSRTRSWTNARTVRHPDLKSTAHQIFDPERKSNYVRYASVFDSVRDGVYRVDEPGFAYRAANAVSIVGHIRIWAPGSDNNKPEQYAQTMCDWIAQWMATDTGDKPEPPQPEEPPMAGDIPGVPFVAADSRHYTKGRTVTWPDLLVQHHTDGWDSLNWLTISPSSNVSSTYLLRHDGTIRAQLVRHADTPHTTGALNPRTLTFEWERKWPEQREVSDEQYRNIGQSWAKVVLAERARGNPNFQSDPKRSQMGGHKDYGNTTCPGNLDIDRVYSEMMDALLPGSDVKPDPNSKHFDTGHYIVNTTIDGTPVNFLDFYEREGGIVQLGKPLEGMWRGPDNVFRQVLENAVLELWPDGFGNVPGPVYRFGRYLDHVDRIRERLDDAA